MESKKPIFTRVVNGNKIHFGQMLPTTTTAKFTLRQRIKILFGCKVQVTTKHYFRHQTHVVAVEARTIILSTKKILERNLVKPPDINLWERKRQRFKKSINGRIHFNWLV